MSCFSYRATNAELELFTQSAGFYASSNSSRCNPCGYECDSKGTKGGTCNVVTGECVCEDLYYPNEESNALTDDSVLCEDRQQIEGMCFAVNSNASFFHRTLFSYSLLFWWEIFVSFEPQLQSYWRRLSYPSYSWSSQTTSYCPDIT